MTPLDLVVIAAYLGLIVAVNRYWAGKVDFAGWLTSKNTIGLSFLIFTVVSTNVGAGTIVGTADATMHDGIGLGLTYGVGVLVGFWIMALVTARIRRLTPAGERSSFQEFFRRRYGRSMQIAVGLFIAVLYFFYLAAQFNAMRTMLEIWAGWGTNAAGLAAALLVIWLTAGAGIRSDMYTDVIHFWAMLIMISVAVVLEVAHHGGPTALLAELATQGRLPRLLDPYAFAGARFIWLGIPTGALLGLPAMENWQRVDAAKSTADARNAFLWAGVLNFAFFAMAMALGFVAAAALPPATPHNQALYRLLAGTLPPGLLGLAIVGIFAALMSTANTMLMVSVACLLSDVLYVRTEKLAATPGILRLTRWLTWMVGGMGLLIAREQPRIIDNIQTALWGSGMLLPAVIGGLYWKRATATAALASLIAGTVLTGVLGFVPGWTDDAWMPGLGLACYLFVMLSLVEPPRRAAA